MKNASAKFLLVLLLSLSAASLQAQYYYKDIIGTRETAATMKAYLQSKVSRVMLTSFDADNTKSDNFHVEQQFTASTRTLKTITRTGEGQAAILISFVNPDGTVRETVDSSSFFVSRTLYRYDDAGNLVSLHNTSTDSSGRTRQSEDHIWEYRNGQVQRMLRIKNGKDTTFVSFKFDEKGNVIEEQETRRGIASEPVQYFYDSRNRLTDIVRYSPKAKRLLPEYLFEYDASDRVIQKITVPANSDKYLIWRYQYNAQGLKTKEVIYNKQKELTGKVEYTYSFN